MLNNVRREFDPYACFYCDEPITSYHNVMEHPKKCLIKQSDSLEHHSNFVQQEDLYPFQCSDCGAECDDKINLEGHISAYHELGTFYCDICPLKFSTNGHLYFHKLSCHQDEL